MLARASRWLRGVLPRRRLEREMADEMAFHIAARAEEMHQGGLSEMDALRRARIEFGAVERYKEECRESLGLRLFDELRADLRYAGRQLLRTRAFTLSTIVILGIGIGASTALFSTADAVLLRLLPVQEPQQLRRLAWLEPERSGFCSSYNGSMHKAPGGGRLATSFAYPVYQHLRGRATSFAELVTFAEASRLNLTIDGQARLANGQLVSGNFLNALGTRALVGRVLSPQDDETGALAYAAVLSHGFWMSAFGGERSVLGRTLLVNGSPVVVVGVLPRGACGVDPSVCPDLMLPMAMQSLVDAGPDALRSPDRWYFAL